MRQDTINRKKATQAFKAMNDEGWWIGKVVGVVEKGKTAFDALSFEMGRMLVEAIMYIKREQLSGPEYRPLSKFKQKWASKRGHSHAHAELRALVPITLLLRPIPRARADLSRQWITRSPFSSAPHGSVPGCNPIIMQKPFRSGPEGRRSQYHDARLQRHPGFERATGHL